MNEIEEKINKILELTKNDLMINFRFFSIGIGLLNLKSINDIDCVCTDADAIYYDYKYIYSLLKNKVSLDRVYMHIVFHLIFGHVFTIEEKDKKKWNLACDISVESAILDINDPKLKNKDDDKKVLIIEKLKRKNLEIVAPKLYEYLMSNDDVDVELLSDVFKVDSHFLWYSDTSVDEDEQFSKQSKRDRLKNARDGISNDNIKKNKSLWESQKNQLLYEYDKNSEKFGSDYGQLFQNIQKVKNDGIDYSEFLKYFSSIDEKMAINDDEFDYIYYNYGMQIYKNVPLIEPLEYRDDRLIKDFVIVIDTSGSCTGDVVQTFLDKTYSILMNEDSFSNNTNIHIIQSDSEVQKDVVIHGIEEFLEFINNEKLIGFGGTDFRPAFRYVDDLIKTGKIHNLKGLIYFTDGYGVYPECKPPYKVSFIFVDNGYKIPEVPDWAMKYVMRTN